MSLSNIPLNKREFRAVSIYTYIFTAILALGFLSSLWYLFLLVRSYSYPVVSYPILGAPTNSVNYSSQIDAGMRVGFIGAYAVLLLIGLVSYYFAKREVGNSVWQPADWNSFTEETLDKKLVFGLIARVFVWPYLILIGSIAVVVAYDNAHLFKVFYGLDYALVIAAAVISVTMIGYGHLILLQRRYSSAVNISVVARLKVMVATIFVGLAHMIVAGFLGFIAYWLVDEANHPID